MDGVLVDLALGLSSAEGNVFIETKQTEKEKK